MIWKKYQVDGEPCIRCSPEIDFLRGEAGTVIMGDFLDDPCTQTLGLKALKSLLDVGLYESMSWARWGAVKWVQNQPRALAANAYEAGVDEGESFIPVLRSRPSGKWCALAFAKKPPKLMWMPS